MISVLLSNIKDLIMFVLTIQTFFWWRDSVAEAKIKKKRMINVWHKQRLRN